MASPSSVLKFPNTFRQRMIRRSPSRHPTDASRKSCAVNGGLQRGRCLRFSRQMTQITSKVNGDAGEAVRL